MAKYRYFCSNCWGREIESGDSMCTVCTERMATDLERALARFDPDRFPNHSPCEVRQAVEEKFNRDPVVNRYCDWEDCTREVDDGEDYCGGHKSRIERDREEEEARWKRLIDNL